MEFIVEILVEVLLEVILQVAGQFLIEVGLHSIAEPFRKQPNPWLAAIGYGLIGATLGALSLWLFPSYLVKIHALRLANLVLSPLIAGGCMALVGAWRARRGQFLLRLDKFSYGYLFALSMAVVRYVGAS